MSGSYREVRDIVKTVVCSKVRFISSCSIYRLVVLPFTEETIDDISLATRLIVPLLFLSLVPSPTLPLIRLPFLLLFLDCLCFLIFFVLGRNVKPRKKSKAQPFKIFNTSILGVRSKKNQEISFNAPKYSHK